ncbi:MAG: DNA polymerase III subunit delta' [Alphaproteobacteria bacterium]|nr:DNA polymerase III subunit delta' [Alphaproteobacteria bacterium]
MAAGQDNNIPGSDLPGSDLPGFNLLGHDTAERIFLESFRANRLHHAWLITGPRGIGKASLAHKIARFLLHNPPNDQSGNPPNDQSDNPGLFAEEPVADSLATDPNSRCNKIISAGGHGDVIVIDRQLNEKTGKMRAEIIIDDVRKLQGFFAMTSLDGGWRVAIIDSADEMNRNAANALLKLLEEPPKNTLLILVAHAPGRLLPTIRSRCRKLRLNPLSAEIVGDILRRKYPDIPPDEIAGYATLSDGSPGLVTNLIEYQGLELYIQLLDILATLPQLDVPLVHKLADGLATKNAEQKYILFCQLLTSFINRLIRHVAAIQSNRKSPIIPAFDGETDLMIRLGQSFPLDQWGELWEKIIIKTGRINLDRKQVVLNILTLLNQKLNQKN